jgi:hypothetical protein
VHVVFVWVAVSSKPAPLKGTRVRHPRYLLADKRRFGGEPARMPALPSLVRITLLVVLALLEVRSKPAPLKGTRVRHPRALAAFIE